MIGRQPPPERVEKIMALTEREFAASLRVLDPQAVPVAGRVALAFADGAVTVTLEHLPPVTLGGLVTLPRARVTLDFGDTPPEGRAALLARFDLAFQRGGG